MECTFLPVGYSRDKSGGHAERRIVNKDPKLGYETKCLVAILADAAIKRQLLAMGLLKAEYLREHRHET